MIGIHSLLSRSCTKAVGEDDEVGEILRLHTEETGKHFDESAEEIRVTAYLENDAQEEGAEQGPRPNRHDACERDHDEANVVNRWAVGCMWLRCRKWRRMMCFRRRLGRHHDIFFLRGRLRCWLRLSRPAAMPPCSVASTDCSHCMNTM